MSSSHNISSLSSLNVPEISSLPDRTLKAGPSVQHPLSHEESLYITKAAAQDHRSPFAKDLITNLNTAIFDMFTIPDSERNTEFTSFSETPEGWHVVYTSSGTDGMVRAIRGVCDTEGTLLVNTDNFSKVAGGEMQAGGRRFQEIHFERGKALVEGTQSFSDIAEMITKGSIKTIHLTENGTTTGVEQVRAIEQLVRIRNEAQTDVLIVVDAVSSQMVGRVRDFDALPDVIYWGNQKDTAVTSGTGNMLINSRALARTQELEKKGIDTLGKLSIGSAYGKNEKRMTARGQTMQTPAMGSIAQQLIVFKKILPRREHIATMQKKAKEILLDSLISGELFRLGFSLLAEKGSESMTTQVLILPEDISLRRNEFVKNVTAVSGVAINNGYGKGPGEKEVRICVYSANVLDDVERAIEGMVQATETMRRI